MMRGLNALSCVCVCVTCRPVHLLCVCLNPSIPSPAYVCAYVVCQGGVIFFHPVQPMMLQLDICGAPLLKKLSQDESASAHVCVYKRIWQPTPPSLPPSLPSCVTEIPTLNATALRVVENDTLSSQAAKQTCGQLSELGRGPLTSPLTELQTKIRTYHHTLILHNIMTLDRLIV
ncbi:hypothetical protein AMECASPLE_025829 [Ameca splendens]|uniref:Uncharacterized protein n=1 Tax=Ameca splendens TaxID=208324 RepID=A0ABV0XHP9_9TELE